MARAAGETMAVGTRHREVVDVDARSWVSHTGTWLTVAMTLAQGVPGAARAVTAWPAESWTAASNLTSLNASGWGTNLSGAYWNPATRRLWTCTNKPSRFWSLRENGKGGFVIEHRYAGTGDLEGITQIRTVPDRVFAIDEKARTIRSYRVSDGAAMTTWFLGSIPDWGNSGPEGLAFVPDTWLTRSAFVDGSGERYPRSLSGANGFGGLMFVAVQTSGWVYAFDLRTDGTFTFVGRYLTSRRESCELTFDESDGRMYILHNIDGNLLQVTDLTSTLAGSGRRFTALAEFQVPSSSNIEGFAVTPALNSENAVGDNWCFFTDDDNAAGALRWFKQLHCRLAKLAGDGQAAEAGAAVAIPPAVLVSDAFSNPLPGLPIGFAVTAGDGSLRGASAVSNSAGIAVVGGWSMGATPGANRVTAGGVNLAGSPVTFTAVGTEHTAHTVPTPSVPAIAPGPLAAPVDSTTSAVPPGSGTGRLALGSPVPSPGHGGRRVPFTLPRASRIVLTVLDVRHHLVATLASGTFARGAHSRRWDGRCADGSLANPGVYYYRLQLPDTTLSCRELLVR